MAKQTIEVLIAGGKATAAPPLGPALGPLGVNIGQVVSEINKKTASFNGMQVPVKVVVESENKSFDISVGTPPVSSLIFKEAGIEKGSGNPVVDKVADLKMEQVIKISKMKYDSLLGKDPVQKVKEVIGSCQSMGIMVEGRPAHEIIDAINRGEFVEKIRTGKTELSAEELKALAEEKKKLAAEMEARRGEYLSKAKEIMEKMAGKERGAIKNALVEAEIPTAIINEVLPVEEPAAGAEKKSEKKPEEKK
ncbi:50S ribosomal protein L11 [Candidatus Woesearchaeota archaeon]|nr:50S ribosomal protein L11 [Candidatus Woesearchaeota archaeon]